MMPKPTNWSDPYLRLFRYHTAFLQGDDAAMQQEVSWAMGKRGAEDMLLSAQSDTEAYYGRFEQGKEFFSTSGGIGQACRCPGTRSRMEGECSSTGS